MALAGELVKYIGNEMIKTGGKDLATKAATSALGNVTNKAISNAANKAVEKSVLQNIGGRIFQNGKPKSFYHGSPNPNIDKLDLSKAGSNTQSGENVLYFTDDYPTAEEFSYERLPSNSMFINNRGKKGKVYEKQLDLKNLVDLGNLSDEQIGNLYEYADAINRYDGKEKFIQRVKEDLLAGNDQSIKTRLDLNALKNSDYDGFIARMYPNQKGLENVREYGVFNPDNVRDVRHIPINQVSNTEEVPVSTLRSLFRGQLYSDTDFSYNSPSMNSGDSAGSQALGGAYHFTPDESKANAWADNAGGGVIKIGYKPDQLLKAEDAKRMIQEAADKLNDGAYMSKLWQTDPELAEQIELVGIGNLEALAKREGKPFVEHINANDNELGTIYYYKDVDEGLTEKFREQFRKTKAEKYLGKPKIQQSEVGLSPQQQEFFKDSVVRDDNGELMPMYHGTRGNFTVFGEKNPSSSSNSKSGVGFWFTPTEEGAKNFASSIWYGDGEPKAMKTYLNLKNPKVYESVDNSKAVESLRKKLDEIELKSKAMSKPKLYYKNMYDYSVAYNMVNQGDKDMAIKWLAGKSNYDDKTATELIEEIDNMRMLEDEKKRIQDEISELKYGDAYERFRTDIYKVDGQTAEDANVGGIGMALRDDSSVQKYVDNLKAEGYDGIIIKGTNYDSDTMGGVNDQYVVFDPEQIKNVDNKRPTKNKDIRYAIAAALGIGSIIGPYMNSQKSVDNIK